VTEVSCAVPSDIQKSIAFYEGSSPLPVSSFDKSGVRSEVICSTGGMILKGKNEVLEEKPVPWPLFQPEM